MTGLLLYGFRQHINHELGNCCTPGSQATENQTCSSDLRIHSVLACTAVGMVVSAVPASCTQVHTSCTERTSGKDCSSPKTAFNVVNETELTTTAGKTTVSDRHQKYTYLFPFPDMPSLAYRYVAGDLCIFGQLTHFHPCRNYLTHFLHAAMHNFYARFL